MKNTLSTFSFYRLFIGQFFVFLGIIFLGCGIFSSAKNISQIRTLWIVDTSLSMAIEDTGNNPDMIVQNRLEEAQKIIRSYSGWVGEQSLIAYARSPALILPFTASKEAFSRAVDNLSITSSFWWSDIQSAFSLVNTLYKDVSFPIQIFLLTDGWNTGNDILPLLPSSAHLTIVGLGSDVGEKIPIWYDISGVRRYKTFENQEVTVPYDPIFLKKMQNTYHADLIRISDISHLPILKNTQKIELFSSSGAYFYFFIGSMFLIFWYLFHPYRLSASWKNRA